MRTEAIASSHGTISFSILLLFAEPGNKTIVSTPDKVKEAEDCHAPVVRSTERSRILRKFYIGHRLGRPWSGSRDRTGTGALRLT